MVFVRHVRVEMQTTYEFEKSSAKLQTVLRPAEGQFLLQTIWPPDKPKRLHKLDSNGDVHAAS